MSHDAITTLGLTATTVLRDAAFLFCTTVSAPPAWKDKKAPILLTELSLHHASINHLFLATTTSSAGEIAEALIGHAPTQPHHATLPAAALEELLRMIAGTWTASQPADVTITLDHVVTHTLSADDFQKWRATHPDTISLHTEEGHRIDLGC